MWLGRTEFSVLSACTWGWKSLCVLPPGPRLTHNVAVLCCNIHPKDDSKGRQRMKMKRRVGECCGSDWGHGSAVSPRCWLGFDVQNSEWAWFLMLCNFWRRSVWSYAWVGLISRFFFWFVFVFSCRLFLPLELFFLWEAQVRCLKWRNVSRVSTEMAIVPVVFAVLAP